MALTRIVMQALRDNRNEVRKALPTTSQLKILNFMGYDSEFTSTDIANHFKITVPAAGGQLTKLYMKGWVARTDIGDPSGGTMYSYKAINFSSNTYPKQQ